MTLRSDALQSDALRSRILRPDLKSAFTALSLTAVLTAGVLTAALADTASEPEETLAVTAQTAVPQTLAADYVTLWKTTDDAERAMLAEKIFADDASHYAAPAGVGFHGRDAILANVADVNMKAIQTAGLKFVGGDAVPNGDGLLVEWSAEAPDGKTVRSGRDVLVLNEAGRVSALYMFTSD